MTISTFAVAVAPVVFAFTMVYAGLTDLTTMKIRNSLVLLFLLAYLVLAPLLGFAVYDIGWSAVVAAAVLVFTFGCYAFGWIGGGDAKLAAVTALWFGVDYTPIYLIYTALLGGALSFAILQFRTMTLPSFLPNNSWIVRLHSPGSGIPYGVAMASAALVVFPQTRWMTSIF
jgi:prepilin peptidase CpaA